MATLYRLTTLIGYYILSLLRRQVVTGVASCPQRPRPAQRKSGKVFRAGLCAHRERDTTQVPMPNGPHEILSRMTGSLLNETIC